MSRDTRAVYLFLYVKDLPVSRRYYRDVLGMRIVEEDESCAKFDAGRVMLALNRAADYGVCLPQRPDDTSISVFHTHGVETLRVAMEKRGVEFSGPTENMDIGQAAAFYDPDGHCYSLYQPSHMAMQWPSAKKIRSILDSQPTSGASDGNMRNPNHERTPGEGLSESKLIYQFIFISDVKKSREFYADILQLPILEDSPHAGVVKYDAGGFILATHLVDSEEGVRAKREDLLHPKNITCVFHVDNAQERYDSLVREGLSFSTQPKESVIGVTVPFQDPDGHLFYLYQPSQKAMSWPSGRKICDLLDRAAAVNA